MGKTCFRCQKSLGRWDSYMNFKQMEKNSVDIRPENFGKKDVICQECNEQLALENSDKLMEWEKNRNDPKEFIKACTKDPLFLRILEKYSKEHPEEDLSAFSPFDTEVPSDSKNINTKNLDTDKVIQYKDSNVCILTHMIGSQKEFYAEFSSLTAQGYELKATYAPSTSFIGIGGSPMAICYFQKMDLAR